MALFKTRAAQPTPEPEDLGFTDESVESLRQRARRRLIGSAILVLLAVIGFPLVFDHEPRPLAPMDVRIEIPNRDQTPSNTPVKATPSASASTASSATDNSSNPPAAPGAVADSEPTQSTTASAPASVQTPPAPETASVMAEKPAKADKAAEKTAKAEKPAAAPDASAKTKPAPSETAAASKDRYVIQIGAFAEADKVKDVRSKLDKAGLKSYIQTIKTNEGPRTRVRVGPFTSEDEARKTFDRVKGLNLQAQLIKL
ncbi:MAG: hypothetical protein RL307_831 [Pseudomonadota bacterium]